MSYTNWSTLGVDGKKKYTEDFFGILFNDTNLMVADIPGNQKRVKELIKLEYLRRDDVFFTPNPMKRGLGRDKDATQYINVIKLDLDVVKEGAPRFMDPIHAYWDFVQKHSDIMPTAIVMSGAGLHLYWVLEEKLSMTGGSIIHDRIVDALCEMLKEYGADRAASKNIAGVLRVPMSYNTKRGARVEVEILDLCGKKYKIDELAKLVLGDDYDGSLSPATQEQLRVIENMEKVLGITFPENYKRSKYNARKTIMGRKAEYEKKLAEIHMMKPISAKQLNYISNICNVLCLDIPQLGSYKGGNDWIKDHEPLFKASIKRRTFSCTYKKKSELEFQETIAYAVERFIKEHKNKNDYKQEVMLFFYRNAASIAWGVEEGERRMLELANYCDLGHYRTPIEVLTRSAQRYVEKGDLRLYYVSTIEKMAANESPIDLGQYIKGHGRRDRSGYYKEYYSRRLEEVGKKRHSDVVRERREAACSLRDSGMTIAAIAEKLGVSSRTIQNDLKAMAEKNIKVNADATVIGMETVWTNRRVIVDKKRAINETWFAVEKNSTADSLKKELCSPEPPGRDNIEAAPKNLRRLSASSDTVQVWLISWDAPVMYARRVSCVMGLSRGRILPLGDGRPP